MRWILILVIALWSVELLDVWVLAAAHLCQVGEAGDRGDG